MIDDRGWSGSLEPRWTPGSGWENLTGVGVKPSKGLACPRHGKPNTDSWSLQQSKGLLQGAKQGSGVGGKPQIHSNLVFELGGFLNGKHKETGINHHFMTFL